ncbi:recombination mediator RecR [Patescibacteria group bacterium]|nr:recombination mediator RecR [Patescibacteria group bacterium]
MYPKSIQKLIDLFSKFPTVGPRTAARFVFYLIKLPQEKFDELLASITNLKKAIRICSSCFNPFEDSEETLCSICRDNSRDKTLLCVIEKETDLISIEKTKKYKGLYFILGGTISFKKADSKKIRIEELKERIKNNGFKEIIIATNSTTEGEATALFIKRELKSFNIKTTRLGRGLPVGGELEYADEDTLSSAFEGRK